MLALAHMRRAASFGAFASLITVGCLPAASTHARSAQLQWSANEISASEIRTVLSSVETAADIVTALRPGMLNPRYGSSTSYFAAAGPVQTARPIQVYVDDIDRGGLEVLAMIPAGVVVQVRRFTPIDAVTRFGSNHPNGVILVTTSADPRTRR